MSYPCECGGNIVAKSGGWDWEDPFLGICMVRDVSYDQCDKCAERYLGQEAMEAMEAFQRIKEALLLDGRPIGEFMPASQVWRCLGISAQALARNARIRRGMIYQRRIGGQTLYLRKSVELFKESGKRDGRFPLHREEG